MSPRRCSTVIGRTLLVGALALSTAAVGTPALAAKPFDPARQTSLSLAVYTERVRPLGDAGGVSVAGDGFGSAVAVMPGRRDEVYGLTDRGPNVDGPAGTKIEPFPDFHPSIGRFRLRHGRAELVQRIELRAADGTPYDGRVSSLSSTGETITDLEGHVLPASPYGYDPEGLVALRDGTFWVSDEYGPFITHFDRRGRAISRLSPLDGSLPAELALRTPNRGMEGLTITPDGRTLVGIMQSALTQADSRVKPKSVAVTRIVTVDLRTDQTHEYAYVLDDPAAKGTAVSEIAALSATRFVVDERDGSFGPGAEKKLWEVDLAGATDVGPRTSVGTYDPKTGVQLGGTSLEAVAGAGDPATTTAALAAAGVTPVGKSLYLDLGALTDAAAPGGTFFAHDKIEGLAVLDGGRRLVVSNDSDFGIAASTGAAPPYGLQAKTRPDGSVDDGQLLVISRH